MINYQLAGLRNVSAIIDRFRFIALYYISLLFLAVAIATTAKSALSSFKQLCQNRTLILNMFLSAELIVGT